MDAYQQLVDELVEQKYLVRSIDIDAFRQTPRKNFIKRTHRMLHGLNSPLPIGDGQTISQPLTVAFMVHLLEPRPGDKILEIGYGSGWQTAILSRIVCTENAEECGDINAYEIKPKLADFGKKNLEKSLPKQILEHIHLHRKDYRVSFRDYAPYDRIIAAAAFGERPQELVENLSMGGIIVYPTQAGDIRKITRTDEEKYAEDIFPGFTFVPITH